jgi:hypothetical protein
MLEEEVSNLSGEYEKSIEASIEMRKDIKYLLGQKESIEAQIADLEKKKANNKILPTEEVIFEELPRLLANVIRDIGNC